MIGVFSLRICTVGAGSFPDAFMCLCAVGDCLFRFCDGVVAVCLLRCRGVEGVLCPLLISALAFFLLVLHISQPQHCGHMRHVKLSLMSSSYSVPVLCRTEHVRHECSCALQFSVVHPCIRVVEVQASLSSAPKEQSVFSERLLLRLVSPSPDYFFCFMCSATNLLCSSMKIGGPSSGLFANITMSTTRSFAYLFGCEGP